MFTEEQAREQEARAIDICENEGVDWDSVKDFLSRLRESPFAPNMFLAAPYIERRFNVSHDDAHVLLLAWMATFKRDDHD